MTTDRKVILYIATNLDGYIAGPDDDLDFLSIVVGDMVILGRKFYNWLMSQVKKFPYGDRKTYIITRTARPLPV